jgi:hypothetical protein
MLLLRGCLGLLRSRLTGRCLLCGGGCRRRGLLLLLLCQELLLLLGQQLLVQLLLLGCEPCWQRHARGLHAGRQRSGQGTGASRRTAARARLQVCCCRQLRRLQLQAGHASQSHLVRDGGHHACRRRGAGARG